MALIPQNNHVIIFLFVSFAADRDTADFIVMDCSEKVMSIKMKALNISRASQASTDFQEQAIPSPASFSSIQSGR